MKKITRLLFTVFLSFFAVEAFAGSIGIQVIQKNGNVQEVRQASYVMEEVLLDNFFDAGLIATDAPVGISNSDKKTESIIKKSIEEANEGQIDVLVVLFIEYKTEDSTAPEQVLMANIDSIKWELYEVATGISMASKTYDVSKAGTKYNNEDGVKLYSKNIATDILKAFNKVR